MSNTPIEEGSAKPVNYSGYLEIDRLLDLQHPRSEGPEHDELLFIVIHQVYELWFKQVLHETTFLQRALEQDDVSRILPTFKRILTIFKTLVAQVDILETMTPTSFNSFRHRLDSASGFQSYQFREFEFRLGHKRKAMVVHHPEGSAGRAALERAFAEPALWDSFLRFLAARGYELPEDQLERDVTEPVAVDSRIQGELIKAYRKDHATLQVCERMVDLDEAIQEWRYRHVKMVERTIGRKGGTGGSAGAGYLAKTLFQPLFPDLWAIRAEL